MHPAVITIGIDREIHLGPVTLAWHGLTIAIGVVIGGVFAGRLARSRGLDNDPLYAVGGLLVLGALVGGRLFYVIEHGGPLLGTRGYTFDGGLVLAAVLIAGYIWRRQLSARYLDIVAIALPLGVAIGRIGDVINGEHYITARRATSSSPCATRAPTRSLPIRTSHTTTGGSTRFCWGSWCSQWCGRCATGPGER